MIRVGILGSTRGTHLPVLVEAIAAKKLAAEIAIVISNHSHAPILERVRSFHLPALFLDPAGKDRNTYDLAVSDALKKNQVDLIVLMGYMRILSPAFVDAWEQKIINVHPSLLPAYAGLMDMNVHKAVLHANEKETGCTVHYVTQEVDAGPIILQKKCQIDALETPETLKMKVQQLEGLALIEAMTLIATTPRDFLTS